MRVGLGLIQLYQCLSDIRLISLILSAYMDLRPSGVCSHSSPPMEFFSTSSIGSIDISCAFDTTKMTLLKLMAFLQQVSKQQTAHQIIHINSKTQTRIIF